MENSILFRFNASDPGGLLFRPASDIYFSWEFSALSTLFPNQAAVTSCTDIDGESGPNWAGFTETRWMDPVTTTMFIREQGQGPQASVPTSVKEQDTPTLTSPAENTYTRLEATKIPTPPTREMAEPSSATSPSGPAPTNKGSNPTTITSKTPPTVQPASPLPGSTDGRTESASTPDQSLPQGTPGPQTQWTAVTTSGTPIEAQVTAPTTNGSQDGITVLGTTVEVEVPGGGAGGPAVVTVAGTTVEVDVPGAETRGSAQAGGPGTSTAGPRVGGGHGDDGIRSGTQGASVTASVVVAAKGSQSVARALGSGWCLWLGVWAGIWL